MERDWSLEVEDGVVVPESPLLRREKVNKYGSVPGLDDEELADPEELLRQVYLEMWGPIIDLPVRDARVIRPDIDENGGVDWGAFGTADFERISPKFDKLRYKVDKLKEQRRDVLIQIDTVSYRLRGTTKEVVLKYVLRGVIDIEHVLDEDLKGILRLHRKADKLMDEIRRLESARQQRREREAAAMLRRWG